MTAFCSSAHSARGRPEPNRKNARRYVTMVKLQLNMAEADLVAAPVEKALPGLITAAGIMYRPVATFP